MRLASSLSALLAKTDLNVTAEQQQKLVDYVNLLNKWNKAYNLTSVRDPEEMLVRHILDSLMVSPYIRGNKLIDVGTGPGLPGIPLAIIRPDDHFTLLDSLGKRVRFMKQVQFELGLNNIDPVQSRVEEFLSEKFDSVISRAFASLQDMLNWCEHLCHENGAFYALKGVYPAEEITEIEKNFTVSEVISIDVPELEAQRHLIVIRK